MQVDFSECMSAASSGGSRAGSVDGDHLRHHASSSAAPLSGSGGPGSPLRMPSDLSPLPKGRSAGALAGAVTPPPQSPQALMAAGTAQPPQAVANTPSRQSSMAVDVVMPAGRAAPHDVRTSPSGEVTMTRQLTGSLQVLFSPRCVVVATHECLALHCVRQGCIHDFKVYCCY